MSRARRLPAGERKRLIIESAREVFAASNYWRVSTADLAKAADISEAALYRHFSGKKEIFLSALNASAPDLLAAWQEIAAEVEDPLETLWNIGLSYYDRLKGSAAETKLFFQALVEADDPDIKCALHKNYASFICFFAELLEDGKRRGLVRADVDAVTFGWQFLNMGLAMDVAHMLGFTPEVTRQKVEVWVRQFLDVLRSNEERGALQPVPAALPYGHLSSLAALEEIPA